MVGDYGFWWKYNSDVWKWNITDIIWDDQEYQPISYAVVTTNNTATEPVFVSHQLCYQCCEKKQIDPKKYSSLYGLITKQTGKEAAIHDRCHAMCHICGWIEIDDLGYAHRKLSKDELFF